MTVHSRVTLNEPTPQDSPTGTDEKEDQRGVPLTGVMASPLACDREAALAQPEDLSGLIEILHGHDTVIRGQI
jgi:hypothetical protein